MPTDAKKCTSSIAGDNENGNVVPPNDSQSILPTDTEKCISSIVGDNEDGDVVPPDDSQSISPTDTKKCTSSITGDNEDGNIVPPEPFEYIGSTPGDNDDSISISESVKSDVVPPESFEYILTTDEGETQGTEIKNKCRYPKKLIMPMVVFCSDEENDEEVMEVERVMVTFPEGYSTQSDTETDECSPFLSNTESEREISNGDKMSNVPHEDSPMFSEVDKLNGRNMTDCAEDGGDEDISVINSCMNIDVGQIVTSFITSTVAFPSKGESEDGDMEISKHYKYDPLEKTMAKLSSQSLQRKPMTLTWTKFPKRDNEWMDILE